MTGGMMREGNSLLQRGGLLFLGAALGLVFSQLASGSLLQILPILLIAAAAALQVVWLAQGLQRGPDGPLLDRLRSAQRGATWRMQPVVSALLGFVCGSYLPAILTNAGG